MNGGAARVRWPGGVGQDAIPSHKGRGHDGDPGRQSRSSKCDCTRLVAIWNALPDVKPVEKFMIRQIALERIWRAVECPEKAQAKAHGKSEQTKTRFREGSKAAQVYALLCRPEGATVHEIQNLTGWQRHSVRGFLSASVRKQGRRMRSFERQGERVYRVKS